MKNENERTKKFHWLYFDAKHQRWFSCRHQSIVVVINLKLWNSEEKFFFLKFFTASLTEFVRNIWTISSIFISFDFRSLFGTKISDFEVEERGEIVFVGVEVSANVTFVLENFFSATGKNELDDGVFMIERNGWTSTGVEIISGSVTRKRFVWYFDWISFKWRIVNPCPAE